MPDVARSRAVVTLLRKPLLLSAPLVDVARALDQFFEVDVVLAKGSGSFALGCAHFLGEFVSIINPAHPTTAAAPAGLQHERIAHLIRQFRPIVLARRQGAGCRHDRHIGLDRHIAGGDLVAE
mgnify:CR=1 FL=1